LGFKGVACDDTFFLTNIKTNDFSVTLVELLCSVFLALLTARCSHQPESISPYMTLARCKEWKMVSITVVITTSHPD
jgi:hypothetical protein